MVAKMDTCRFALVDIFHPISSNFRIWITSTKLWPYLEYGFVQRTIYKMASLYLTSVGLHLSTLLVILYLIHIIYSYPLCPFTLVITITKLNVIFIPNFVSFLTNERCKICLTRFLFCCLGHALGMGPGELGVNFFPNMAMCISNWRGWWEKQNTIHVNILP